MKYAATVTALCLLLLLAGCRSRGSAPPPSSSEPPPVSSAPVAPPPSSEPTSAPAPSSSEAVITDPAQREQAREIISALLERAGVADEIYRLALTKDSMMFPETLDGKEYLPVIDERFATVRDIQDFLDKTFTKGGEAAKRFEALQAEAVYSSINNQLYILREGRQKPLTLCGWKTDSMELLLLDDKQLEARMETTMAGQPDGKRVLRIIRDGESWLLGDSFFFD